MTARRDFLQRSAALAALLPAGWRPAFGREALGQQGLLEMPAVGRLTLIHLTDLTARPGPSISASRPGTSAWARWPAQCRI